jgi:thymidylate synthase
MDNNDKYNSILEELESCHLIGNGTRELINFSCTFDPRQQLDRAKQSYVDAELSWYLSMQRNITGWPKIGENPIWKKCATAEGSVNSNYGWCVFSEENGSQYDKAIDALLKDQWSRQSIIIYTRPEMHDICRDGVNANYDFICTNTSQHFIRNGRLEYIVNMRSNDVEYGLPYDLAWHQFVYNRMLTKLQSTYSLIDYGLIHWNVASLHKYEKRS